MRGDVARALGELRSQYDSGADPLVVLTELAEFTHFVTRVKVVPTVVEDRSLAEIERKRGRELAAACRCGCCRAPGRCCSRASPEVKDAPRPIAAAEMVLVRIAYAADLPPPDEVDPQADRCPPSARARRARCRASSPATSAASARALRSRAARATSPSVSRRRATARRRSPRSEPLRARPQAASPRSPQARTVAAQPRRSSRASRISSRSSARSATCRSRPLLERDVRLVAVRRRQARDRARAVGVEGTDRRSRPQAHGADRPALDGRGVGRSRRSRPSRRRPTRGATEFMAGVQSDPLVQTVLARFPGAQIVAVRERDRSLAARTAAGAGRGRRAAAGHAALRR